MRLAAKGFSDPAGFVMVRIITNKKIKKPTENLAGVNQFAKFQEAGKELFNNV